MTTRQAALDARLLCQQPVQRLIGFPFRHAAQPEYLAQARTGRARPHCPHKPELRAWRHQPVDDHCHDQVTPAHRLLVLGRAQQQPVEGDLAHHPKRRPDMTMGQAALDPEPIVAASRPNHDPALK